MVTLRNFRKRCPISGQTKALTCFTTATRTCRPGHAREVRGGWMRPALHDNLACNKAYVDVDQQANVMLETLVKVHLFHVSEPGKIIHRHVTYPPPHPIFCPEGIFQGGREGGGFEAPPRGTDSIRPPPSFFIRPPTPRRDFSGLAGVYKIWPRKLSLPVLSLKVREISKDFAPDFW